MAMERSFAMNEETNRMRVEVMQLQLQTEEERSVLEQKVVLQNEENKKRTQDIKRTQEHFEAEKKDYYNALQMSKLEQKVSLLGVEGTVGDMSPISSGRSGKCPTLFHY